MFNWRRYGLPVTAAATFPLSLAIMAAPASGQLLPLVPPPAQTQPVQTATRPAEPAAGRPAIVEFQPGIRIDWARRQVEVDGEVVLREGLLELFACSPNTREHESIVRVHARPLHIYQALGLIGIEPGHPIRLNPETQKVEPARGGAVEIDVRYEVAGQARQHPIEQWMRTAGKGRSLELQPWIFAGSAPTADGNFMADAEGTVIAVVDFACALVALPEFYSDRNDELWLEPATEAIPERFTPCTLIFRHGPLRLTLDASGRLLLDNATVTSARLAQTVRQARADDPDRRVRISIESGSPASAERMVRDLLRDLNVPEEAISTSRPDPSPGSENDPQAMIQWLRQHLLPAGPPHDPDRSTQHTQDPGYVRSPRHTEEPAQVRSSQPRYLIEDLRERSLALRARTQAVADYATQLAANVERFFTFSQPPAANPED